MHKAFDNYLNSEVLAELASINGQTDRYRYVCICCGEEVYIAAQFSSKMIAHFRHLKSNNNTLCENYLGKHLNTSEYSNSRRISDRVEFYYFSSNKTINIALNSSDIEIEEAENKPAFFELRSKLNSHPFNKIRISKTNFSPESPTYLPLSEIAPTIYLSNTFNGKKQEHRLYKNEDVPIFFKILGKENDYKARLVSGNTIYINTSYFVVFHKNTTDFQQEEFREAVVISKAFQFSTANRVLFGVELSFMKKNSRLENLLHSWGYRIETSETLTLLWPPSRLHNLGYETYSNFSFVSSSFTLRAHGNTNLNERDITDYCNGIYKLSCKDTIKISYKNAEMTIYRSEQKDYMDSINMDVSVDFIDKFIVPNYGTYYLFNKFGVSKLVEGQTVYLTPTSEIVRFQSVYPQVIIHLSPQESLSSEDLLQDILAHYKLTIPIDKSSCENLTLSEIARNYFESCCLSGTINYVVLQYIKEGKL